MHMLQYAALPLAVAILTAQCGEARLLISRRCVLQSAVALQRSESRKPAAAAVMILVKTQQQPQRRQRINNGSDVSGYNHNREVYSTWSMIGLFEQPAVSM